MPTLVDEFESNRFYSRERREGDESEKSEREKEMIHEGLGKIKENGERSWSKIEIKALVKSLQSNIETKRPGTNPGLLPF